MPEPERPPADGLVDRQLFATIAADCEWTPAELGRFYVDGTREQLEEMRAALAAGDAAGLQRLAHGSVGSSSTCGVTGMVELFRELERTAGEQRLQAGAKLVDEAERRLRAVELELDLSPSAG